MPFARTASTWLWLYTYCSDLIGCVIEIQEKIEYEEKDERNLKNIWNRPNKNKKRRKKQTLNIGLADGTFREIETADGEESGRNVSCYFYSIIFCL